MTVTNIGTIRGYDHVTWYVSNAKQSAAHYVSRYGFETIGFQGLETGSRDVTSQVIQLGSVVMVFKSALRAHASETASTHIVNEIHDHVRSHGDGVKDVAFGVDDVHAVFAAAVAGGAKPVKEPTIIKDVDGSVTFAIIDAYGDTTHTLIDRSKYHGVFMPGFAKVKNNDSQLNSFLGESGLYSCDHIVANQDWHKMNETCEFYERAMGFHRFWCVDDGQISTEFSALSSIVMANSDEGVKMPINQPEIGLKRSQIEEFVDFYNGPGIQHLALRTDNIIHTIRNLRLRGVEFIAVPHTYYENLKKRLEHSHVHINESLRDLEALDILVDFDNNGYLLQMFTKPLVDRPTIFFEIIQRNNFDGFGAGNFKALFEAIERDQEKRGTL